MDHPLADPVQELGIVTGHSGEHDELVPADPAHHVVGPTGRLQTLRDQPQQVVGNHVPERVVDRLEAVDVHQ